MVGWSRELSDGVVTQGKPEIFCVPTSSRNAAADLLGRTCVSLRRYGSLSRSPGEYVRIGHYILRAVLVASNLGGRTSP